MLRAPGPDLAQIFQPRTPFLVRGVLEPPYCPLSVTLLLPFPSVLLPRMPEAERRPPTRARAPRSPPGGNRLPGRWDPAPRVWRGGDALTPFTCLKPEPEPAEPALSTVRPPQPCDAGLDPACCREAKCFPWVLRGRVWGLLGRFGVCCCCWGRGGGCWFVVGFFCPRGVFPEFLGWFGFFSLSSFSDPPPSRAAGPPRSADGGWGVGRVTPATRWQQPVAAGAGTGTGTGCGRARHRPSPAPPQSFLCPALQKGALFFFYYYFFFFLLTPPQHPP